MATQSTAPAPQTRTGAGRVVAIILGTIVVLLGVIWLLATALQSEGNLQESFGPVERVTIRTNGHVDIRSGESTEVNVDRRWVLRQPEVSMSDEGGELRVIAECGWFGIRCRANVSATVPADAEVIVETSAGTVTVEGMTGGADVTTSAGGVEVDVTGPVVLHTSAGSVRGTVRDGDVDAATSAGSVDLEVLGEFTRISAVTSAGQIWLRVPDDQYRVDADTSAGDITTNVATDPDAERDIYARSSAGSITIDRTSDG